MPEPLVMPNWHVVIIHFPLGLFGVGVLLEILSHLWPKSGSRAAARWMILLGALLAIPTITLGLYAFRQTASPAAGEDDAWRQAVAVSPWNQTQWKYMTYHLWLEVGGALLALLAVVIYLASGDEGRRKLYWPGLIALLIAAGLMGTGAWFSGESVYRYGTAVAAVTPAVRTAPMVGTAVRQEHHEHDQATSGAADEVRNTGTATQAAPAHLDHHEAGEHEHAHAQPHENEQLSRIERLFPPIQVHMLMVGITIAFALAAIGLSIRRWSQPITPPALPLPPGRVPAMASERANVETPGQPVAPAGPVLAPATVLWPVYPARFWLTALFFAVISALAGIWLNADWKLQALIEPLRTKPLNVGQDRVFWHVVFGVSIITFTFLLAISTKVAPRSRFLTSLWIILLLVAVGLQVWMGVLLLFDGMTGPLTGFRM